MGGERHESGVECSSCARDERGAALDLDVEEEPVPFLRYLSTTKEGRMFI